MNADTSQFPDALDLYGIPEEISRQVLGHGVSAARAWREHLGLSQAEVATRLGIPPSEYAREEARSGRVSQAELAAALGISVQQLHVPR